MLHGLGFRYQGLGVGMHAYLISVLWFRVQGSGFRVPG